MSNTVGRARHSLRHRAEPLRNGLTATAGPGGARHTSGTTLTHSHTHTV